MYTAVSVVQANNSSNADEVGKAMKKHAEMGLRGQRIREDEQERKQQQQQERKQEQQQERKQEQQEQQRQEQQQQRGGTAYVARAVDGNVELGAGSQVSLRGTHGRCVRCVVALVSGTSRGGSIALVAVTAACVLRGLSGRLRACAPESTSVGVLVWCFIAHSRLPRRT